MPNDATDNILAGVPPKRKSTKKKKKVIRKKKNNDLGQEIDVSEEENYE